MTTPPNAPEDDPKLKALKAWRIRVKGRMLPFHVMPDKVLKAIVAANPKTVKELAEVEGIGEARLRKYAADILAVLKGAGQ